MGWFNNAFNKLFSNNKIGSGNTDIGNNKRNKYKNNIINKEFSPKEIVEERSKILKKLQEKINILYECEKCKLSIEEALEEADKRILELQQTHGHREQHPGFRIPVIINNSNLINKLIDIKHDLSRGYIKTLCENHKYLTAEITILDQAFEDYERILKNFK